MNQVWRVNSHNAHKKESVEQKERTNKEVQYQFELIGAGDGRSVQNPLTNLI